MKKILVLALISIFVLAVFVACGSGNKDNMKDDITTMMDDMSSGLSEMDEALTQGGNITSEGSSTEENLLEEIMPEDDITDILDESTTDISGESTTGEGTVTTE